MQIKKPTHQQIVYFIIVVLTLSLSHSFLRQHILRVFQGGEQLETDISKCELLKPTTRCQHAGDSWATDSTNSVSLSDMSEDDAGVTRGGSVEVTASSSGSVYAGQ